MRCYGDVMEEVMELVLMKDKEELGWVNEVEEAARGI